MEQSYKGHRIEVSVWLDDGAWFASLYVYYQVEHRNILVTFSLKEKFKSYGEGVEAGLAAAQSWIDEDKPDLNT